MRMRRLEDTPPMGAFDHKGRCVYANTPLAAMLGYTPKVLRGKDISQLLPQPYGVLHLKWLKVRCLVSLGRRPGSLLQAGVAPL
jgi:PAS domain S-box-containing protein